MQVPSFRSSFLSAAFLLLLSACDARADNIETSGRAKQNLHTIQLALERAGADGGGGYPADFSYVQTEGYLPKLPANPYAKSGVPMAAIPLGQHSPGDFNYIADTSAGGRGLGSAGSYALVLFGKAKNPDGPALRTALPGGAEAQAPWDYVILVLQSGS